MGILTDVLKLFKTNMETDGNDLFDFDRDLNQNWDKIDEFAKDQVLSGVYYEKIKNMTIYIPGTVTRDVEVDYYEVNG